MPNEMTIKQTCPAAPALPSPDEGFLRQTIHSEVSHAFTPVTPFSILGEWASDNLLPDSIGIGVSHVLT